MLEDSLFESQRRKKTRNPLTVVVSAFAHLVTVGVLVFVPLFQTQALTVPAVDMSLFLPRTPISKPVEVFPARPPRGSNSAQASPDVLRTPEQIPDQIAFVNDPPTPGVDLGIAIAIGKGISGLPPGPGVPTGEAVPPVPPALPAPPPPVVNNTKPVRVSHLEQADLIHQVNPVYPPLARQTRAQGIVVLEATINKEGTIESLRVVSGHPLLTQAALDAVKQWRYRPLLLNGEPIDIITTVTVRFTLQ